MCKKRSKSDTRERSTHGREREGLDGWVGGYMDEWVEERDQTSGTLKTEIVLKSCGRALAEHTNTQNVLHFGKPFFMCELKDL